MAKKTKTSVMYTIAAFGTNELLATISTGRTAVIRKVMMYAPGVAATFRIGVTDTDAAGGVFTALLPTMRCLGGFNEEWGPDRLPQVEIPHGPTTGQTDKRNIFVVGSVNGAQVQIEYDER